MFARAHFFNQSKNTINYKESARLYGDTLKSIREALCSSSERQHDASITAVWILGNYEVKGFFEASNADRFNLSYRFLWAPLRSIIFLRQMPGTLTHKVL